MSVTRTPSAVSAANDALVAAEVALLDARKACANAYGGCVGTGQGDAARHWLRRVDDVDAAIGCLSA